MRPCLPCGPAGRRCRCTSYFSGSDAGGIDHQAELADRILLGQQEAFHDAVVEQRADLAGFDFLFHDRAHDNRRQRPAEQLLVAEKVRRILFGRGLADALLIQGVGLAVGRDHADAEDRLFFAPGRPIGLGARPVVDAFIGEEAVDPPRGAMLPALLVELIDMLFEEHFDIAVFRRRRRGRRMQDVLRLGRERGQVPRRFHRGRGDLRREQEYQDDNAQGAGRKDAISIHERGLDFSGKSPCALAPSRGARKAMQTIVADGPANGQERGRFRLAQWVVSVVEGLCRVGHGHRFAAMVGGRLVGLRKPGRGTRYSGSATEVPPKPRLARPTLPLPRQKLSSVEVSQILHPRGWTAKL